jgi:hypothetical protein
MSTDAIELQTMLSEIRAMLRVLIGVEAARLADEHGIPHETVTKHFVEMVKQLTRANDTTRDDLQRLLADLFGGPNEAPPS